jgi:hypothetical protein
MTSEKGVTAFNALWTEHGARDRTLLVAQIASVLVLLSALLGIFLHRRRMANLRPETRDSPEFKEALKACSKNLPPNPRATLRFTNLARFTYYQSIRAQGRESAFFDLLIPYWATKRLPSGSGDPELREELRDLLNVVPEVQPADDETEPGW